MPCYLWARYLFQLGAAQLVKADPGRLNKTVTAMHLFFTPANNMLSNGTGLEDGWGAIRRPAALYCCSDVFSFALLGFSLRASDARLLAGFMKVIPAVERIPCLRTCGSHDRLEGD